MGEPPTPSPYMPPVLPLPLPPPSPKSNLPLPYYGVFVVGTAALILVVYNLLVIKWCSDYSHTIASNTPSQLQSARTTPSSDRVNSMASFKYQKHGQERDYKDQDDEYECAVCLSKFEEGEQVRKLPRCKHSFHASCIDMWLYSHSDCPLCRAPVEPLILDRSITEFQSENSREGLLHADMV